MATRQEPFGDVLEVRDEPYLSHTETTINTRETEDGEIEEQDSNSYTIEKQCPTCGSWYGQIGNHWGHHQSDCEYPPISYEKWEMLKGLLMGDGCLDNRHCVNKSVRVVNTNLTFIEYLRNNFDWVAFDFVKSYTSKEKAKQHRDSGFRTDAKMENRFDQYELRTRSHPKINKFEQWWETGELKFPQLEFTPELLRMWYVSDGCMKWKYNSSIDFISSNESTTPQNIINSFNNIGLECNNGNNTENFRLPTAQTEDFFDYIGHDPVPGFEYKWAWKDKDRYKRLKKECEEKHKTQTFEIRN